LTAQLLLALIAVVPALARQALELFAVVPGLLVIAQLVPALPVLARLDLVQLVLARVLETLPDRVLQTDSRRLK
jgi:hypothetical protein